MLRKRLTVLCLIMLVFVFTATVAEAVPPYKSYTYTFSRNFAWDAPSPMPYVPSRIIDSSVMGVDLGSPEDFCYDKNGNFYIIDSVKNQVVVLDKDWKAVRVISKFMNKGKEDKFNRPNGLFVTENGDIYVADMSNARIVQLNNNGEFIREIGKPTDDAFNTNVEYKPKKLVVDKLGNLFIVGQGENNGIIQLDSDGSFIGYLGANKVTFNVVEMFWKKIMTQAQRKQMVNFVPIEYGNISLDSQGFMFAVAASDTVSNPLKRLNPSGGDVLVRRGWTSVSGDIKTGGSLERTGTTRTLFIDVVADKEGFYSAIDSQKGRIFTYNSNGDLLYVFGNMGGQFGTFKNPSAIESYNGYLYVLDRNNKNITEFKMTDYAKLIRKANTEYMNGEYTKSMDDWAEVLKFNSNFELAYVQTANVMLRDGRYEEAMKYYRLGNYRGTKDTGYSKAYKENRKIFMRENFGTVATVVVVLVLGLIILSILRKRKKKKGPDLTMEGAGE